MKKYFAGLFASLIFIGHSMAQEFDLVAEMGNTTTEEKADSTTKFDVQKDDNSVADDRGIFSFLNFSFIKKTFSSDDEDEAVTQPTDSAKPEIKETPLQRKIRRAEEGSLNAQLALGYMYLYGQDGVQADYNQAFKYYEMAANQNNPIALNNLGSLYFNGIGTERDYYKAAQLFDLAAKNGSDDAAINLAFIYLSGNSNTDMQTEAVKLFMQAANSGNNTAKFMLGYAYYTGFHVEQNYHKAVALFKDSAEAKFDEGQYMLALMYLNGQGIAQNYGRAVNFMFAAANQGNLQAAMHLADILENGVLYPKNLAQAYVLYNIAAIDEAPGAAQKRDEVQSLLKMEELLKAQTAAEEYKAKPSELTTYTRQTFGHNVRRYIDENINKS